MITEVRKITMCGTAHVLRNHLSINRIKKGRKYDENGKNCATSVQNLLGPRLVPVLRHSKVTQTR